MKITKNVSSVLLMIVCVFAFIGCSNGKSPVEASLDDSSVIISDLPEVSVADFANRSLLAVFDAMIDPVNQTFTVTPDNRTAQYHFPLTQMFPNCLQITGYGFTPNFWADIKLRHPLPGSGIDAFDPRVIAILPANPGVSFNFPIFNCSGNDSVVLGPDGYTKLHDNLGGSIPGNTNPFVAYFKDQPYRVWSSTGLTEETKRWQMNLAGFGGSLQYKLVVDVSTNYPNPSTPVTDNAPEPVQIETYIEQDLTTDGGSSLIEVTLLDWQGSSEIKCKLESPQLFNSAIQLFYSRPGLNPNEYIFSGTISNSFLAAVGEYPVLISAWDIPTDVHVFSVIEVSVIEILQTDGNLIWVRHDGGTSYDVGYDCATLSDDTIVASGIFRSTAKFGAGESNEKTLTSAGSVDIFLARYNPDGTLIWAKRAGGDGNDIVFSLDVLSDDSILMTGNFEEIATFGKYETNQTILESAGNDDIFIAKYNADGTVVWAKRAGGSNFSECGFGITGLDDNSIVVTGMFAYMATFGPGEPGQTILSASGMTDIFIARYNPDGTLAWVKRVGDTDTDLGRDVTALSDNSIIATGGFAGDPVFGEGEPNQTYLSASGSEDIFIARYNPDGTLAWAKKAGGSSLIGDEGRRVTALSDDTSVVTGSFSGSATFGRYEPNQTVLAADGDADVFIARYNSNGTLSWAKRAGGSGKDNAVGIARLSDNSTVLTGWFENSSTFGPAESNETVLVSVGMNDIFISRYNPDGTLKWAKGAGGTQDDFGSGAAVLSNDSIIVTGGFYYPCTFGAGELNETILTSTGWYDIFLARFMP